MRSGSITNAGDTPAATDETLAVDLAGEASAADPARGRRLSGSDAIAGRTGLGAQRYLQLFEKLSPLIGNHDKQQIALRSCELIAEMLDVAACSLFLYAPHEEQLQLLASTHIPLSEWAHIRLPIAGNVCGEVFTRGESLLINGRAEFRRRFGREPFERYLTPSCAIVPLLVEGRVIGVINMAHPIGRRAFRMRDIELLEAAVHLIGGAFSTALQHEENLELQRNLIDIFDSLHVGIASVDADGRVGKTNERLRRMFGIESGSPGRHQLVEMLPEPVYRVTRRLMDESARDDEPAQDRLRVELNGVPRLLEVTVSRMLCLGPTFGYSIVIIEDVTRDEEVKRLRESENMKRSFLSIISHELRTPLAVIRGALPLLESRVEGEAIQPGTLSQVRNILQKNTVRLSEVVNTILDVTEIENGTFMLAQQEVDVHSTLNEILDAHMAEATAKRMDWQRDLAATQYHVQADRRRIEQVFHEMIHNALKFSAPGSMFRVRTSNTAGWLEIALTNTGVKIDADTRKNIFEKFFQCNQSMTRAAGGCGLGLFVARSVVRMHGGQLELLETDAEETTFCVRLPVGPAEERLANPAPPCCTDPTS